MRPPSRAGAPFPRSNSEGARIRRLAVQGTLTALDSPTHVVFDRRFAVRDIGWLRAVTAEGAEQAGVSAGRCGYRESGTERDRDAEHDFGDQQGPFLMVTT